MSMQLSLFNQQSSAAPVDEPGEEWRPCPGFPRYEVSSHGRFRRLKDGRFLKLGKEINGYLIVQPVLDGRQTAKLAHRLVCEAFHGPPPEANSMVNHINRVKHDNRAMNLEWVSRSQNAKHWWRARRSQP